MKLTNTCARTSCLIRSSYHILTHPRSESFYYLKTDISDFSNLEKNIHQSFRRYVADSYNSISLHFAARLSALVLFEGDFIGLSINVTWNFLIWHQLVYQAVAIKHPEVFGLEFLSEQNIRHAVNQDIQCCFFSS